MAEELEELWKKLMFTKEEDEDIVLGSNNTRVVKEVGKNCIVMKVLTQRRVSVEALKKNMRMLWKPNKGIQISEIEDNLYLAKFGDSWDKKKCMTSGTGYEIGAKIEWVIEVDVPEKRVQWGKHLRVRVNIDTSKKLVRGKKVSIEGGDGR
ncbi:hypothetical protein CFP56_013714 [Quercus suber]|uniref:DUF4283 domain-containing protein n=1 Tax=Quercus suber TaxID=58331 RepID=A0AAW0KU63_QUESU|nr:hypothetical protein CFP56_58272 [Quercus suber]